MNPPSGRLIILWEAARLNAATRFITNEGGVVAQLNTFLDYVRSCCVDLGILINDVHELADDKVNVRMDVGLNRDEQDIVAVECKQDNVLRDSVPEWNALENAEWLNWNGKATVFKGKAALIKVISNLSMQE